jgi:hypothetical protein
MDRALNTLDDFLQECAIIKEDMHQMKTKTVSSAGSQPSRRQEKMSLRIDRQASIKMRDAQMTPCQVGKKFGLSGSIREQNESNSDFDSDS